MTRFEELKQRQQDIVNRAFESPGSVKRTNELEAGYLEYSILKMEQDIEKMKNRVTKFKSQLEQVQKLPQKDLYKGPDLIPLTL